MGDIISTEPTNERLFKFGLFLICNPKFLATSALIRIFKTKNLYDRIKAFTNTYPNIIRKHPMKFRDISTSSPEKKQKNAIIFGQNTPEILKFPQHFLSVTPLEKPNNNVALPTSKLADPVKIGGQLFKDVLQHLILPDKMEDRMRAILPENSHLAGTLFAIASGVRLKVERMKRIIKEILDEKLDEPCFHQLEDEMNNEKLAEELAAFPLYCRMP